MKARIKKTGEIVNLAPYAKIAIDVCDSWGKYIELKPEEVELIQEITEDTHWQDVRESAAIAAMQGMLSNSGLVGTAYLDRAVADYARIAIDYADELVKQLKETN